MSSKSKLFQALESGANGVKIAYGFTKNARPYIIFNLVSNVGKRLSNERHSQKLTWQVDYYNNKPLDVQGIELSRLQDALETAGGVTTEWIEIPDVDEKSEIVAWRYMLEVVI